MSPELNGNQQPILPKRNKKGRERKHASTSNIRHSIGQFPMPAACNIQNLQPYSYCPYPAAPGFAMHPEPMSLPIFPPTYHYGSPPVYNGFGAPNGRPFAAPRTPFTNDECMSLPVVTDDVDEEEAGRRRFSDPGVPNESDASSEGESRMLHVLTHQVNVLQESNRQLMREVTELRMEITVLKQQQMHGNGFDRDYEPGMISDFIKEIRDAARIREDALLAKVKHIVEEKQFADNQIQLSTEKTRHSERIAKLEEQIKLMNVTNSNLSRSEESSLPSTSVSLLSSEENVQTNRQVCELEREVLQLRREVQDSRAKKEESDNKIVQLEKRLALLHPHLLHRRESVTSDDKASVSSLSMSTTTSTTLDNLSLVTSSQQSTTSLATSSPMHHKFMQVGPVTDL